jgi:hypothetical protein
MPEEREARSLIEEAEQAAAAGNFSAAEELLREAAARQEQTLGLHHPDLANTLNNLGVVCELTDNPIDAEHYFRRARSIATATLAPDHPFVATSSKNLHDFCAARGRPVELPPSPPGVAAWLDAHASRAPAPRPSPPAAKRALSPVALGALSGIALLIVVLMMDWPRGGVADEASLAPAPTPPPVAPIAATQPAAGSAESTPRESDAISARPAPPKESTATPTVVTAQLCTALTSWHCEPADSEVPPGRLFFYTQVRSATATTVEHRWYQGELLRQAVPLSIQANSGAGYRTFSRNTITGERVGDWRVELRGADGAVLHEERFTVR